MENIYHSEFIESCKDILPVDKCEMIPCAQLILRYPKSQNAGQKIQIRSTQFNYLNQPVTGEWLETSMKNWFLLPNMTVRQNIGITLRHLYMVDNYMQEEYFSQHWQMFCGNKEIQDVRDLEANCEIILQQKLEIDIPNHF